MGFPGTGLTRRFGAISEPVGCRRSRIVNLSGVVLILSLLQTGCGSLPAYPELPQQGLTREPEIIVDDNGIASTEISVLIYNVAALPWPASSGKKSRTLDENDNPIPIDSNRKQALKAIGDDLAALRVANKEPDVILIQEAFISSSTELQQRGGYPNWVSGPGTRDLGPKYSERASPEFIKARRFWKGEKLGKWQSSGLLLVSNFPILRIYSHPFNQWECAGFDCLANKGLLAAVIDVPGVPQPLALITLHFNSQEGSGVSAARALTAHKLQIDEVNEYLRSLDEPGLPYVWGGDLNMGYSFDRIAYFMESSGEINEVSSYCVKSPDNCEVGLHWDTDTPWYETEDLQGWMSGSRVDIVPVRVSGMFDEPVNGYMPSDHDGLLVHYKLSWPIED